MGKITVIIARMPEKIKPFSGLLTEKIWITHTAVCCLLLIALTACLPAVVRAEEAAHLLEYPLVVYSGEPEGVMAAVAAARQGMKTLLIMERENPGGLMTYGGLNYLDLNHGPDGRSLNRGIFAEWHRRVGGGINFSIDRATRVFNQLLNGEERLDVLRQAAIRDVEVEAGRIKGLTVVCNRESYRIKTELLIDASQNADLAAGAGALLFTGGADIGLPGREMAVTLILHLGGINWEELRRDVRSQKFGLSYLKGDHAWGFVEVGRLYRPVDPLIKLRGLNIVRDREDEVYINSMLIFGVDPLDRSSLAEAYRRGVEEARHVLNFLRENLAGFTRAELREFPRELYVRESRHLVAEYQLQAADLLANRIFKDTVTLASYPLDYQASRPEYDGFVLFNPVIYGIPLCSLISRNLSNLMVVGRSSGYSSLAAASARVLPTGMNAGEAAGIAAALSLEKGMTIKELSQDQEMLGLIQEDLGLEWLVKNLTEVSLPGLVMDDELLPYLEELLSWGLIIGGYNNDFQLNRQISEREFAHMIVKGLQRREAPILYQWVPGGLESVSSTVPLSRNQAAMLLLVAVSQNISGLSGDQYYSRAGEFALIPDLLKNSLAEERLLTRREAYILLGSFLKKYDLPEELQVIRGVSSY